MSTAAIYALAAQDQPLKMSGLCRLAVRHGLSVLKYPERHAKPGTRPVFNKMLRDAADHKFDVVIVQSLDCFARSLADLCTEVTGLHLLGIQLVAVNERIDLSPHTSVGRRFLSTLTVLVNARKNMLSRNVRERLSRAPGKGVQGGGPRRIFPCPQALKLQKQGLPIREIAARIGFPVSTVGTALKPGSGSCVKAGADKMGRSAPASAGGKRSKGVRGARLRRIFPIYDADQLREQGLTIREVAAKIDFPVSTVADALKAHRLDKARRLAAKLERIARASLKRAELKKADSSEDGGLSESKADAERRDEQAKWAELHRIFNTRTEPNSH